MARTRRSLGSLRNRISGVSSLEPRIGQLEIGMAQVLAEVRAVLAEVRAISERGATANDVRRLQDVVSALFATVEPGLYARADGVEGGSPERAAPRSPDAKLR
jgi:hypothetical protein